MKRINAARSPAFPYTKEKRKVYFLSMNHSHSHSYQIHKQNVSRLIIALILNFIIFLTELTAGLFSNSLALISDSIHNLNDFGSILITLSAHKLSLKKATHTKSYGFKRAETIGAILNVAILLAAAFFLLYKGITRIHHQEPVSGSIMIWVSIVALIANSSAVLLLQKGAASDLGIKSVVVHLMADAISSCGVIITGIIVHFTHSYILDPFISIVIAFFILWNCWGILKEALNILLEGVPGDIDLEQIKNRLEDIEKIIDVHHIHVWGISSKHINASFHILVDNCPLAEVEKIMAQCRKILNDEFRINHATIQPETRKYETVAILCQSL